MGLKFRRGTTAQQSGSLAFGEPYVNTTLGTLVIGGQSGDIVLSSGGTGSTGNFGAISGSGLDITGNANIAGNLTLGGAITIGDASADTVNVVASISSSLIPSLTNAFDLGSETKIWRDLYISTGSIKFIGAGNAIVGTLSNSGNGMALDGGVIARGDSTFGTSSLAVTSVTGSLAVDGRIIATSISGAIAATNGIVSGSSQITYASVSSIPAGIVSGSAQVTPLLPTGVISGSSQLDNTTITNLTVTNLTTVNETASVLFSSGSNRFGDFGDDIHSFTGSVKISGSTIITGSVSATSFNGTINATNGVVSGSSQITYANVSSIPAGIVSGSSQITYANISSIPAGIVSGSSQTIANLPTGTVSGSSQITYANISSIPGGIVSGSSQTIANLPTGTVSGSSQLTSSYDTRYSLSGSILTSFSASIDYRLDEVEYTASLFGGGITAQLDKINQATASLQLFSASAKISIANLETATSSYETKGSGIVSGSSQIVPLLPTGVVSGSIQILGGSGVWSGSAQLPSGVVSGSSQILGSSTIHSGSTNNYQFNSIGVGSTTVASGVDGEIRAQADITAFYSSDERLKENIQPIVDALSKVESISGNTYDWKAGFETIHSHTGHDIGVIAQEIEKVLPEVVINRETGYKAVQYEKIIPLLIEAIKELSAKVKELESK